MNKTRGKSRKFESSKGENRWKTEKKFEAHLRNLRIIRGKYLVRITLGKFSYFRKILLEKIFWNFRNFTDITERFRQILTTAS